MGDFFYRPCWGLTWCFTGKKLVGCNSQWCFRLEPTRSPAATRLLKFLGLSHGWWMDFWGGSPELIVDVICLKRGRGICLLRWFIHTSNLSFQCSLFIALMLGKKGKAYSVLTSSKASKKIFHLHNAVAIQSFNLFLYNNLAQGQRGESQLLEALTLLICTPPQQLV